MLGHHLKIWADKYPFRGEIKCHSRMFRPEKIVVTSNCHPAEIWDSEDDMCKAIVRRFKIRRIDVLKKNDDTEPKLRKTANTKINLRREDAQHNLLHLSSINIPQIIDLTKEEEAHTNKTLEMLQQGKMHSISLTPTQRKSSQSEEEMYDSDDDVIYSDSESMSESM